MRAAAAVLLAVCVVVMGAAALDLEATFRSPASIAWWLGAPAATAVVIAAFLALPARGKLVLGSAVFALALLELGSYGLTRLSRPEVETWIEPEYYQDHPNLGYGPMPGITARAWKRVDGRMVYDVRYSIDDSAHRVTPVTNAASRSKFVLIFGGSFAFGEGVEDDETLAFQLGELAPDSLPYAFGFHGYGPQSLLATLEAGTLRDEVRPDRGTLVYVFIDSHVNRAIGSFVVYTSWASATPHYVLDATGTPIRRGNLTSGRPLLSVVYSLLGLSPSLGYLGAEIPLAISEAHIALTASIFARSASLFRDTFEDGRFVVAMFPGSKRAERLGAALRARNVEYLDYSALLDYDDPRFFIADDWHPAPETYRILAERLVRDLDL